MLYWNVELYRKLGHMAQTTGDRTEGPATVSPRRRPVKTVCDPSVQTHAFTERSYNTEY